MRAVHSFPTRRSSDLSTVLGDNFSDYSNFRSRLLKLGFLSDTGIKVSRGAGRPASLYRFDAEAFAPYKDKPMVDRKSTRLNSSHSSISYAVFCLKKKK